MAARKVGTLIKEARTAAGMTQEQLARKVTGASASDIGKAERGEKDLTQDQLKQIAKATGVTQKSLLEAAKGSSSAKKTTSSTAKKTSTSTAKKTSSTAKKTAAKKDEFKLTAAEKKIMEMYRAADSDTKQAVQKLLKGESGSGDLLKTLFGALTGSLQ